jgi:hypothetical protein
VEPQVDAAVVAVSGEVHARPDPTAEPRAATIDVEDERWIVGLIGDAEQVVAYEEGAALSEGLERVAASARVLVAGAEHDKVAFAARADDSDDVVDEAEGHHAIAVASKPFRAAGERVDEEERVVGGGEHARARGIEAGLHVLRHDGRGDGDQLRGARGDVDEDEAVRVGTSARGGPATVSIEGAPGGGGGSRYQSSRAFLRLPMCASRCVLSLLRRASAKKLSTIALMPSTSRTFVQSASWMMRKTRGAASLASRATA